MMKSGKTPLTSHSSQIKVFLAVLLLLCLPALATASDYLLGATLEQCKALYGEPTRVTQRENDTVAVFEKPTFSFDMAIRHGFVERVIYKRYNHPGEAFLPLEQEDLMKVLNLCDKDWKPAAEVPFWKDFESAAGNIGQYNLVSHTFGIITPAARRHIREETGSTSSSPAGKSSSAPEKSSRSDGYLPQTEAAADQTLDIQKYFREKATQIEKLNTISNQLPLELDVREALNASLKMNLDLLQRLMDGYEKRFGEAMVSDIGNVDKKLTEHEDVAKFFKEKAPLLVKAARDVQQIKDPDLFNSMTDGLTAGSLAISKLMDMHPNPLRSKDREEKAASTSTSNFEPISKEKIQDAEASFRTALKNMLGLIVAPATDEQTVTKIHDTLTQLSAANQIDFSVWSGDSDLQEDLKKAATELLDSLTRAKVLNRDQSYSQAKLLLRNATSKLRTLAPRLEKAVEHVSEIIKKDGGS